VSQEAYEQAAGWAERGRVGDKEGRTEGWDTAGTAGLAVVGSAGVIDDAFLGSQLPRVQGGAEEGGRGQGEGKRVGEVDGDGNGMLFGSMAVNSKTLYTNSSQKDILYQ